MECVPDQQIDPPDDAIATGLDGSDRMYDSWAAGDYDDTPHCERPPWVRELDECRRQLNGLFGPCNEGAKP